MILQSNFVTINSKRQLKSYAGVDIETYRILYARLEKAEANKQSILSNRPNRQRQYGAGCKERLISLDDKLLFILHYYKSYPTMDIMAIDYKMSRSSVWNYVHALSAKLYPILVELGVMPLREMPSIEAFKALLLMSQNVPSSVRVIKWLIERNIVVKKTTYR
jgi:Helix-turn-helix of DDE superfamily endonuclease